MKKINIKTYKLDSKITKAFIKALKELKEETNGVKDTCTILGFQSENILKHSKYSHFKDTIEKILKKKYNVFHIHLIDYEKNGYQLEHDHKQTEDCSFILYLNDCDTGHTVFEKSLRIKPEKNKLIVFKSDLKHYGETCLSNKKIAVGAMSYI
jgi:hypothetical protein